jgi:membrane dipeptidase
LCCSKNQHRVSSFLELSETILKKMIVTRRLVLPFIFVLSAIYFGFTVGNDYKKLHFGAIVLDAHNDVTQRIVNGEDLSFRTSRGHSDIVRFREGGVDVEFFSIWVPPNKMDSSYYYQADIQIDSIMSFVKHHSSQVGLATSVQDVNQLVKEKRFAVMLGMEGGHPIENDLKKLKHFYQRGVRYLTLTWNNSTDWATSAKDEDDPSKNMKRKGLSKLGVRIIRKMNELGMMVDVSHIGEKTFWDVIKTSKKPVIASHSSVWTLCKNRRNLKDEQIRAIAKSGGIICINFAPFFIDSTFTEKEKKMREDNKVQLDSINAFFKLNDHLKDSVTAEFLKTKYLKIRPPLRKLIDHFDYVAKLVGIDYVGIGSDFDGIGVTPLEMDDVSFLPNITQELVKRGYSDSDVRKILGQNFLRVLRENEVK